MDKWFHPVLYNVCNYLSMLGLKQNHVSKRGPWFRDTTCQSLRQEAGDSHVGRLLTPVVWPQIFTRILRQLYGCHVVGIRATFIQWVFSAHKIDARNNLDINVGITVVTGWGIYALVNRVTICVGSDWSPVRNKPLHEPIVDIVHRILMKNLR